MTRTHVQLVALTTLIALLALVPAPPRAAGQPERADKGVVVLGSDRFHFRSFRISIAYSADGKLFAVSEDDTVHVYDAATKKELRTWDNPGRFGIKSLAFSPDGKLLAAADQSPRLRLWDVATGRLSREFDGHRSGAWLVTFSPDGKWLATAGDDREQRPLDFAFETNSVRVWDAATGRESAAFAGGLFQGNCAAFSPDGVSLAWGGFDGKVHVRKLTGGDDVFTHVEKVELGTVTIPSLDFSRDGKTLAVGTGGVIKLFDVAAGKHIRTLAHEPQDGNPALRDGYRVRFSPDGKTLGSVCNGVALWDVSSGKLNRTFSGLFSEGIGELAFHPDGKKLAGVGNDRSVRFWDPDTGREEFEDGYLGPVGAVALSPDGKEVVTANADGVRFWDRATRKELRRLDAVPAWGLVYAADGLRVVGSRASGDRSVRLYDAATGADRGKLGAGLWLGNCAGMSADGRLLAVGQQDIRVIELPSGKEKVRLAGHGHECRCLAFGPGGKTLVSGGMETLTPKQTHGMRLWDLTTGKELRRLPHPEQSAVHRLAYSPDGRYVMTNQSLYDFGPEAGADLATVKLVDRPAIGKSRNWPGNLAVFSPDGTRLAVAWELQQTKDKIWIELWDTAGWRKLAVLEGHKQRILALAFSADGRSLVSSSRDTTVRVWDVSPWGK